MHLFIVSAFLFISNVVEGTLVDLSHNYNESTLSWPTAKKFILEQIYAGFIDDGGWLAVNDFCTSEHSGTHIDAPYHFNQNGWTTDQIPLDHLFQIPVILIDISERISQNTHPLGLSLEDLLNWENTYGQMPDKAVVVMHSGWVEHWFDANDYFNTTNLNDSTTFNFPGIEPEAALWLVENRSIVGVGVDSPSADGKGGEVITHRILLSKNIYILENLANVDTLPAIGAELYVFPIKIQGGTGGPCRVVAKF